MESRVIKYTELSEQQVPLLEKAEKNVLVRGWILDSPRQGIVIRFELGTVITVEDVPTFFRIELLTGKRMGAWTVTPKKVASDKEQAIRDMLADWNREGTHYRSGMMVLVFTGSDRYHPLDTKVGYLHPQFMQLVMAMRYELLNYIEGSEEPEMVEGCRVLAERLEGIIRDQWRRLSDFGVKAIFD